MSARSESSDRDDYEYVRVLLEERKRALQVLELEQMMTPLSDYLSCRRSLLQAIKQLEGLLAVEGAEEP